MQPYLQVIKYLFNNNIMKKYMFLVLVASLSQLIPFPSPVRKHPDGYRKPDVAAKRGMEDKFEVAVLAHNKKFHPDGPYVAALRKIDYGPKAGWYVWVMGPTAYSSLDSCPTKESGHDQDWNTMIDPLVQEYGVQGYGITIPTFPMAGIFLKNPGIMRSGALT